MITEIYKPSVNTADSIFQQQDNEDKPTDVPEQQVKEGRYQEDKSESESEFIIE